MYSQFMMHGQKNIEYSCGTVLTKLKKNHIIVVVKLRTK